MTDYSLQDEINPFLLQIASGKSVLITATEIIISVECLATELFPFLFCFCWDKISLCSPTWSGTHNPLKKTNFLQVIGTHSMRPHSLSHPSPLCPAALCHLRRLEELPECDRSLSRPTTMGFHVFPLSSLGVTPCRKYTARSSQLIPQT